MSNRHAEIKAKQLQEEATALEVDLRAAMTSFQAAVIRGQAPGIAAADERCRTLLQQWMDTTGGMIAWARKAHP